MWTKWFSWNYFLIFGNFQKICLQNDLGPFVNTKLLHIQTVNSNRFVKQTKQPTHMHNCKISVSSSSRSACAVSALIDYTLFVGICRRNADLNARPRSDSLANRFRLWCLCVFAWCFVQQVIVTCLVMSLVLHDLKLMALFSIDVF